MKEQYLEMALKSVEAGAVLDHPEDEGEEEQEGQEEQEVKQEGEDRIKEQHLEV